MAEKNSTTYGYLDRIATALEESIGTVDPDNDKHTASTFKYLDRIATAVENGAGGGSSNPGYTYTDPVVVYDGNVTLGYFTPMYWQTPEPLAVSNFDPSIKKLKLTLWDNEEDYYSYDSFYEYEGTLTYLYESDIDRHYTMEFNVNNETGVVLLGLNFAHTDGESYIDGGEYSKYLKIESVPQLEDVTDEFATAVRASQSVIYGPVLLGRERIQLTSSVTKDTWSTYDFTMNTEFHTDPGMYGCVIDDNRGFMILDDTIASALEKDGFAPSLTEEYAYYVPATAVILPAFNEFSLARMQLSNNKYIPEYLNIVKYNPVTLDSGYEDLQWYAYVDKSAITKGPLPEVINDND